MMCFENIYFVFFLLLTSCEGKSYKNHALLRGVPYDYEELVFLKKMEKIYNVTWWRKPTMVHNPVEFSISPRSLAKLYRDTEKTSLRFSVLIKNIQSAFNNQAASPYIRRNMQSFNWHNYYRLHDIYEWLKDLSANHREEVQLRRVGTTHENRTILAARLNLIGSVNKRSTIIVEGGCHGREWLSPAFVTYMLYTMLNAKDYKDEELQRIAYMYTWIFVPVMNPDGYEYSHTTSPSGKRRVVRCMGANSGVASNEFEGKPQLICLPFPLILHNKVRNCRKMGKPVGIDFFGRLATGSQYILRLFSFRTDYVAAHSASKDLSSDDYCGVDAFSEPESYAMATLAYGHKRKLEYYLSFHSYGQYIIIPYMNRIEHEGNYKKVKQMADKAAFRISENHGIVYKTGTSFDTVGYLASGVSADWVKRALNVSYAVTIELPDRGVHGFALPPGRILPACQATLDGLLSFLAPQTEIFMRAGADSNGASQNRASLCFALLCNLVLFIISRRFNLCCTY